MTERAETTAASNVSLPPILRTELENAPAGKGPWFTTIGPAYLGIFVWAPFFDALWIDDLARFSLPGLIATAVCASLLCFVFFYYVPATWGFQTGRPLGIVAASTFGTTGSEWITGVAVGAAGIVWYAVAVDYAVDSTFLGLRACGLIEADSLSSWDLGPIAVKSPVYLTTALFWIYITGTSALWKIPGVVVALMKVYAPIALLLLTTVALLMVPVLEWYSIDDAMKVADQAGVAGGWRGRNSGLQMMTGFFALAGLAGVDWGARLERRRDVVLGGLAGVVLAASWTAIMSLLVIAGAVARLRYDGAWPGTGEAVPLSFRWAVYHGIGGYYGGGVLILFGLAALAPACYSAWVYSQKLATHWPRLGQAGWTWFGGGIALFLGATSYTARLDLIFFVMGAMFAPAAGAMAADWLRQRGGWAGVRPGFNNAGVIAWGAGLGITLAAELGRAGRSDSLSRWYSAAMCGFFVAFACYWLLERLGPERGAFPIARHEIGQ